MVSGIFLMSPYGELGQGLQCYICAEAAGWSSVYQDILR